MVPSDFDQFRDIVAGFAELKGKSLSPAAIKLYWGAMQKWSIDEFEIAAQHLLTACEFMPTPKDFEDLRKAGRHTSGEAFINARETARKGWRKKTCGVDLIDRAVNAIGGYDAIGMCETDKLHFLERRFAEHYESMQDCDEVRQALPAIADLTKRLK